MTSNKAEWFWVWCHLNSISTIFEAIFSYYSIIAFSQNFRDFWVLVFGYRPQQENPEIMENLYLWVYKVQIHMNLFFDHYFNFLSAETKINKKVLNLINLDRLEAFKRHKYHTWIAMWLDHFENDVIWATFQLFLKLHFHITVLWRFCRISEFSFLGIGLKMKTRESRKISIFGSAKFKCTWMYFSISF